ncbi:MAG: mechanosensitive ion channel [Phycisphaerae bacterium]|nr:mechanosensitive ion channel [Phycisphaerae bacterium]
MRGRSITRLLVLAAVLVDAFPRGAQAQPPSGSASQPATASGAAPSSQPTSSSQPAISEQRLTLDEARLRLQQAQASVELNEGEKATVIDLYSQAIQQLQLAAQCAAVAEQYETERLSAPEQLRTVQSVLQRPLELNVPRASRKSSTDQLEAALSQIETELERARISLNDLITLRDGWLERRLEIPNLLTAAKQKLVLLAKARDSGTGSRPASVFQGAQETLIQAQRIAIETEIQRYEKELLNYAAQREVLEARLKLAQRRQTRLESLAGELRREAHNRRRREIEGAVTDMREWAGRMPPSVRKLARTGLRLAEERLQMNRAMHEAEAQARDLDQRLVELRAVFETVQKRVQAAGMTSGVGELLRKDRAQLPDTLPHEQKLLECQTQMGDVRRRMSELDGMRTALAEEDQLVRIERRRIRPPDEEAERVEAALRECVHRQQEQVDALLDDYGVYFDRLVHLNAREREFVDEVRHIAGYVDANVLWVRSGPPLSVSDVPNSGESLTWLIGLKDGRRLLTAIGESLKFRGWPLAAGLVLAATWIALRRRMRAGLARSSEWVFRPGKDSIFYTFQALVWTCLLAGTWPALMLFAAWFFSASGESPELAAAITSGSAAGAAVFVTLLLLAHMVSPNGLAERHFRWRAPCLRLLRFHLHWLMPIVVPAIFAAAALEAQSSEARKSSLGRAAFIFAFLALAVFSQRLLRPGAGIMPETPRERQWGWSHLLCQSGRWMALAIPLALAAAAALGYYFTALTFSWKLLQTTWLLLALLILWALLSRWLLYKMQQRALREAKERAAAAARQEASGESAAAPDAGGEPAVDMADIRVHSSRLARAALATVGIVGSWMIWADVLPALEFLRGVTLWTDTLAVSQTVALPDGTSTVNQINKTVPITLMDLGAALVTLVLTFTAARNIPGLLEVAIMERLPLTPSSRFAIATITGYVLSVVGITIAFNAIGVGWSKVQWLAAAMTVGLGFGLQEIFANFISGLIILFERPIRVGDAVTVGGTSGIVTRIRMRATTIVDWDRKELIVPNKRFITGEVLNWTLTDLTIRLALPVSVAHGSNAQLVRDTLVRIAKEHPKVEAEPPPSAMFRGLGPSSMDFELSVFVRRDDQGDVLHELNSALEDALVAIGVGIAVPIHLQQLQVRAST